MLPLSGYRKLIAIEEIMRERYRTLDNLDKDTFDSEARHAERVLILWDSEKVK